jgi:RNA polymerase sigma-70 factor (ECF subfamily)
MARNNGGDDAARFRAVALPCLDEVYTLARYLVGNPVDAEDAVQECYLRALKYFGSFKGPAIKPWLFSILRNVCYAELSRRGTLELRGDDENEGDEPLWSGNGDDPETAVLRKQDGEAIRGFLAALPLVYREALVLREVNELSYGEIANVTGVPIGTVMSRLARGRALLRDAWNAKTGSTA